jgi:hypothetical protein
MASAKACRSEHARAVPAAVVAVALVSVFLLGLVGCASFYEGDCTRFEQLRRQTDYSTHYRYEARSSGARLGELPPLPPGQRAAAPLYRLALDRREARPCSHLVMEKALFLHRTAGQDLAFEELREFYAENGARITTNREDLTKQFPTSGYYAAEVKLPIPAKAPPGRYRIVSKLVLRQGRHQQVLAEASTDFRVIEAGKP